MFVENMPKHCCTSIVHQSILSFSISAHMEGTKEEIYLFSHKLSSMLKQWGDKEAMIGLEHILLTEKEEIIAAVKLFLEAFEMC